MTETRKPKYLKQEPPTPWEEQTAEVLAMVNSNPNRRADVDNMVIVMEGDRMFLTHPGPTLADKVAAVCAVLAVLVAVVLAVLVAVVLAVVAMSAPTIGPRMLSFGTVALFTVAIIINAKGEKKNVQQ